MTRPSAPARLSSRPTRPTQSQRSERNHPDRDYDVIVHQCHDGHDRNMWRILIGGEKQGAQETLALAIKLARNLALVHRRPAWLLDKTGCPVMPIG